jgi:hypothetical protein
MRHEIVCFEIRLERDAGEIITFLSTNIASRWD